MKRKVVIRTSLVLIVSVIGILLILLLNNNINQKDKNQMINVKTVENVVNIPFIVEEQRNYVEHKEQVEAEFGKPYLSRKVGKYTYEIRRISDGSKLYVIYYSGDGQVRDTWRIKKLFKREDFQSLKPTVSTYEEVISIDEYCAYWGAEEGEGITEHRLVDNECLIIHYTKKNNVAVVKKLEFLSPDPSDFSNILLKKDLKQIMP